MRATFLQSHFPGTKKAGWSSHPAFSFGIQLSGSMKGSSLAVTSSMMKSGTVSLHSACLACQSRDLSWWQWTAPCVAVPVPVKVTRKPLFQAISAAPWDTGQTQARPILLND
jgi:hypothetical protein